MTLPPGLVTAIMGLTGDPAERERLIDKWTDVLLAAEPRAASIRESVARARCSCFRPGRLLDGRCGRCYGVHPEVEREAGA